MPGVLFQHLSVLAILFKQIKILKPFINKQNLLISSNAIRSRHSPQCQALSRLTQVARLPAAILDEFAFTLVQYGFNIPFSLLSFS